MPEDHPHQHFLDQFVRWEAMGRGSLPVAEAPVALEPPYSPFLGYRIPEPAVHDDGHRPGLFSRIFEISTRRPNPQAALVPAEPELAFTPLPREDGVREITVTLPHDFKPERGADAALLSQLSRCAEPLSFEILADHTSVVAQFTASAFDEPNVTGTLRAYFPEAIFVSRDDVFTSMIERSDCESFHILECGLGREFLVPLAAPPSDALVGFVGALGELDEGQFGMYQFLFHPARHPWGEDSARAMRREDGRPLPWIDGEILKASEEKFAAPLYSVVVRFCGGSYDEDSMWHLMMRLASPFQHFAGAKSNFLVPLSNGDYDPDEHIRDLYYRRTRRAGLLLSASELRGLVHMPTGAVRTAKLSRQIRHSRAAPAAVRGGEGLFLGVNEHHGEATEVFLSDEQRGRHVHIVGSSGTGKSTLLYRMIGDDIRAGRGVGVLDPHGDLIDALLAVIPDHRVDDVVLLDPSDTTASVAFNILTARSETEKTLLASDLVSVFQRLSTSWGDQMNIILRNAILAFLESPRGGTLSDMRRFLVDKGYRQAYAATIADPDIRYYWEKTFDTFASKTSVGAVVTRLEDLLAPKPVRYIVSQDESTLDFADIMDSGKIFLCRLSQGLIGKENSHLFGSLIVAKIQQTAMSRQRMETGRRRHFWLYVDEFQNFITPSMAEILSEARKYRLGLVLAHQSHSQMQRGSEVSDAVLANTNVRIVFRVGDADAKTLAGGFGSFDAGDIQSLERGHALCRVERADHDFNLYSPLPDIPDPDAAATRSARVTEASRRKYAIARATVEARLRAKLDIPESAPPTPTAEAPPAPPSSPPTEPLSESPSEPPSVIILPPREVTSATADPDAPSPAVEPSAAPSGLPGKGGAEHRELQQFVKEIANKHGYRATIEEPIGDGKSIDVALETDDHAIACEITIETPGAKELANIQKAIDAGFDKIILICPNPRKRKKLQATIESHFLNSAVPIKCVSPSEFDSILDAMSVPEQSPALPTIEAYPSFREKNRGFSVAREFSNPEIRSSLPMEAMVLRRIAELMRGKPP